MPNNHKSEDYKISAVQYYLNNKDGYKKTCKIFGCKRSTLRGWINKYKHTKTLKRKSRKYKSYKITKPQVKTALDLLKSNEQFTINELVLDMKKKYPTFDISPQHLGQIVRDNNRTRKRTRHEHFPKERYKKPIDKQSEMDTFYSKVRKYPLDKIICLDETSVGSALKPTLISNFKKIFGNPEDVVICIGDWEQKKQMKFKEPTLGIGMRTLFRKNNYKVFLVDEFRSSCKCSNCNGGLCEKFMVRKNPRPNKDDIRLVHGLLRCKSGCGLWNRDRNGSSNIYKIAEAAINKLERPSYLCREIKVITPLNRMWDKQTLHGNENPNLENPSIYTKGGGFKSSRV
jgi:transposase-like protein